MKVAYKHLLNKIPSKPSIEEISEKLLQLGHEHEIENDIFDIEFTPNRGDCLSIKGILRDLSLFYEIDVNNEKYEHQIDTFELDFENKAKDACPEITFLKIELEDTKITNYQGNLKDYFDDLNNNKINFFTDISNYISYETGQPTHCYDAQKINNKITLENISGNFSFETLQDKKIDLYGRNLVFKCDGEIINLAGIIGNKNTSCSSLTDSVIVECAYFNPEEIIGKSVKYDINSEAAYKFERNVDQKCHINVLRRFLKIASDHSKIRKVEIFTKCYKSYENIIIPLDINEISNKIGIKLSYKDSINYLEKLGFLISNKNLLVPSYRTDIKNQNDLSEEIARAIGYDNLPTKKTNIANKFSKIVKNNFEYKIKSLLIDNGFNEVINNPFVEKRYNESIKVDNPLDSNRTYMRTTLKDSLIDNLLYNERRQKDSVKLFEISDVYCSSKTISSKKILGIIASGRVGKNYENFSKKIDDKYLTSILKNYLKQENLSCDKIDRNSLDTKLKTQISYLELELNNIDQSIVEYKERSKPPKSIKKYKPVSDFPSSMRDLSFSITDYSKSQILEELILNYNHELLKEVYIFDFYVNNKSHEIKVGYRFIFQSDKKTITDSEVEFVINDIISKALDIQTITLPGLLK